MKVKSLLFFLAGIFFVSCVSMQDDLIVNSAYEGNALYDKYIPEWCLLTEPSSRENWIKLLWNPL